MKKVFLLSVVIILVVPFLYAGDTIRVMQYNLLYYDMITDWCTSSNNNVSNKDSYLRTITGYYSPDIFTVNEMNGSTTSVNRLLSNVFNQNSSKYKRANYSGVYLVNMLYYNSEKLELKSQSFIQTSPRQADVYRLYYKSKELELGDTTFITCIVAHLKAGSTSSDASDRATAAQQIMAFINNRGLSGNILLMGDFNLYTSSEAAFQAFMTSTLSGIRFYDPVNALGDWQNNSFFAKYHTQSTSVVSGCPSSGGMDDRFDFILSTQDIIQGNKGAKYVSDSYWAFGQDGKRLNKSIADPANTSLPSNIISALSLMSDHLPVVLKLYINATPTTNSPINNNSLNKFEFINPIQNEVVFLYKGDMHEEVTVSIFNQFGAMVKNQNISLTPGERHTIDANNLTSGIYLVKFSGDGFNFTTKIVKI